MHDRNWQPAHQRFLLRLIYYFMGSRLIVLLISCSALRVVTHASILLTYTTSAGEFAYSHQYLVRCRLEVPQLSWHCEYTHFGIEIQRYHSWYLCCIWFPPYQLLWVPSIFHALHSSSLGVIGLFRTWETRSLRDVSLAMWNSTPYTSLFLYTVSSRPLALLQLQLHAFSRCKIV